MSPARIGTATARGPQTQDQSHLRVLGRARFSTLRRLEDSVDVLAHLLPRLRLVRHRAPGVPQLSRDNHYAHDNRELELRGYSLVGSSRDAGAARGQPAANFNC